MIENRAQSPADNEHEKSDAPTTVASLFHIVVFETASNSINGAAQKATPTVRRP